MTAERPEGLNEETASMLLDYLFGGGLDQEIEDECNATLCVCGAAAFCPRNGHAGCLMRDG